MMKSGTRLGLLALGTAAALTLVLASCGGKPQATGTQPFVVSFGLSEPKHLIPSNCTEEMGHDVLDALFVPLVEWDDKWVPRELAAESITSPDNKVWTIKLRAGWTFHNGEPVTADSYINAWNAGAWGPNAHDANYFFSKIEGYGELNPLDAKQAPTVKKLRGLKKKDELTFEVTLQEPYVNFKSMLGYTPFFPLPDAAFADVANNQLDPAFEEAPIGQGAFQMKGKWQHDSLIQLVRYEGYAGPVKPVIDGIDFKIYQKLPTQYQDLLAGQLDIVPQIPLENIANAPAELGSRFRQSMGSTIQILAFPTYDKRFAKVEIRKAISMAIDRDQIVHTIFSDAQVSLRSFVAPFLPGYRENTCGEACEFNPARARALFEAAGGAKAVGGRIEFAYNVDGGHKPWIDAACNQIRTNLGVECVGNPQPKFADLLRKAKAKESMGLFRMGWVADYPVLENYLGPLYATTGSSNYYGYSNAEYDRLLAAGDRAATPEEAIKLYQQAEDILTRELPVLPLRYMQNTFGVSARIANVEMNPFRLVRWLKITPAGS
jgi:peptide/nickel transport system substrate-binding protein/oligopeptide transport system substrate-binding protein